jgi:hypothetical protein
MTDRQTVLQNASELAHFDSDFDMDLVYRLQHSMQSSVDNLALYGLSRVSAWLWPLLSGLPVGGKAQIGPFQIVAAEKHAAAGREQSKQSYHVHAQGKRWKLAWLGMEAREAVFGVGVDPDGFFSVAACEFRDKDGKPNKGGVSGRGSEISSLFDFLILAGKAMPAAVRNVGADALAYSWEFHDIKDLVNFDDCMGATFGAELHDLAEQRACKMLCDIAALNTVKLVSGLKQNNFVYGKEFLRSKNVAEFALEGPCTSIVAFYSERFPGGEGDRYLTWCDLRSDGSVESFHTYVLPPEKLVSETVAEFAEGLIKPSCSHDYSTGKTTFADTVMGYTHLATATIYLHQDTYFVSCTDASEWDRSTHFDNLDEHIAYALTR